MSEDQAERPNEKPIQKPRRGGMMGGPMGGQSGPAEKPKNFKKAIGKLLGYLRPYKISLIVLIAFAIGSTIFTIVSPKILGNVTNKVVEGFSASQIYDQVESSLPKGQTIPDGTTGAEIYGSLSKDQQA
ncbi:MAG: hypothetical protein ABI303_00990, partial [Candidatus Saccharimonas sp.]